MKNKTIIFYDFKATGVSKDADPISLGLVAVTKDDWDNYKRAAPFKGTIENPYSNTTIKTFYAEFTDFEIEKCDDWGRKNIVDKLVLGNNLRLPIDFTHIQIKGNSKTISQKLKLWLSQFEEPCFYADFDVIDKPMLIDLIVDWDYKTELKEFTNVTGSNFDYETKAEYKYISHKVGLPKHLPNIKYYDFYDLHTLIKKEGFDLNIDRKELAIESITDHEMYNRELKKLNIKESKHDALYNAYLNWKMYDKLKGS